MSIFGGQPSITTPTPPPCDSPKVVIRKSWPKVLPIERQNSDRFESELQIVDEIAQIFDADGNSDKRISDAERVTFFFRHGSVRHERGMINQAFDAAQTFREREEIRVL